VLLLHLFISCASFFPFCYGVFLAERFIGEFQYGHSILLAGRVHIVSDKLASESFCQFLDRDCSILRLREHCK
jgi:hypothetical protein